MVAPLAKCAKSRTAAGPGIVADGELEKRPGVAGADGVGPRYTPSTTFETFPFPAGLTPDIPASEYAADPRAVAVALEARRLVELRDRWLNPPEWVEWVDEPVAGYPKRPVPRDEAAAQALKKRTLTKLYNARPQWLADAHDALDAAVAAAYGWSADITDDDALRELLKLNRGDECSLVRPPAANGESLTFSGYCRHRGTAYARPPVCQGRCGMRFPITTRPSVSRCDTYTP